MMSIGTSGVKPMLYGIRTVLASLLGLLLLAPVFAQTDNNEDMQAREIIARAIVSAGGGSWGSLTTLIAHESQARNTDEGGKLQLEIDHTMDTKGRGYRMEISSTEGKRIYGWDGKQFWASIDGKPGDEAQVKEAKRLISDAFFRFSMPFILGNRNAKKEYTGEDTVNGKPTKVVKFTYQGGPVDSYWKAADSHEHHGDHGGDKPAAKTDEHAKHDAAGTEKQAEGHNGHHDGNQVYFFHFDEDDRIVKIYFSHHGDDTYETFLFDDFTTVDGITREQSRKLIHSDGKTLYDTRFSRVEFKTDSNTDLYSSPHH